MSDFLNRLWIIDSSGTCLIDRSYEGTETGVDASIFSGFLTAILTFTQEMVQDEVEQISMGSRDIYYQPFRSFAVVASVPKKKKIKNINDILKNIGNVFLATCGTNYSIGNKLSLDNVQIFSKKLDEIVGDTGQEIEESKYRLLSLFKQLQNGQVDEEVVVKDLLSTYESLDNKSQQFIAAAMKDVELIFKNSNNLTPELKSKLQNILRNVSAQMRAEKWLSSF